MCDITRIPGIMRTNGWNNGAALMDEWFANPPNDVPENGTPDTSTIKMDSWVLTFERAKKVYDEMISGKIWFNEAAKNLIVRKLEAAGKFTRKEERFGDLSQPANVLDPGHIQERPVGEWNDPMDDMYAALGKFTLRMAIEGVVIPQCAPRSGASAGTGLGASATAAAPQTYTVKSGDNLATISRSHGVTTQELIAANPQLSQGGHPPNDINAGDVLTIPRSRFSQQAPTAILESCEEVIGHTVRIDAIGIYVRDSYDFNGIQFLGRWDIDIWDWPCLIFNANFSNWRSANGKGGDYLVYSDVKVIHLSPADSF